MIWLRHSCVLALSLVAIFAFETSAQAQDEEVEVTPSESGSEAGSESEPDAPEVKSKSPGKRRYLEFSLFGYEITRGRRAFKSSTGNKFEVEDERDFVGVQDQGALRLGLYGKEGFIYLGVNGQFDYDLTVGWHKERKLEVGLEFDYTNEATSNETLTNGAVTKVDREERHTSLGLVVSTIRKLDLARAKASVRLGLLSDVVVQDDEDLADALGFYAGLEAEYSRPLRAFGAQVEQVYGIAYRYENVDDAESQDFAPLTGEASRVQHFLSFKLFGLRVNF